MSGALRLSAPTLPRDWIIARFRAARLLDGGHHAVQAVVDEPLKDPPWRPATPCAAAAKTSDPSQVVLGRSIYADYCASCHGVNLQGQPDWRTRKADRRMPAPPHDASGHTWHHSDEQLLEMTRKGASGIVSGYQSDMPGFEDILSEREIEAVLSYIKSRWPPEIRRRQEQR